MFVRIEADEGRCLLLFFGYAFLVLERAALPRARRSLVTQSRGKQMLGPVSLRLGIAIDASASTRRNNSWCLISSSLNRTRASSELIAEAIVAAQLQDLDVDVALDEPEYVRVRAALNLAHEPAFLRREERERVHERPRNQNSEGEGVVQIPPASEDVILSSDDKCLNREGQPYTPGRRHEFGRVWLSGEFVFARA